MGLGEENSLGGGGGLMCVSFPTLCSSPFSLFLFIYMGAAIHSRLNFFFTGDKPKISVPLLFHFFLDLDTIIIDVY